MYKKLTKSITLVVLLILLLSNLAQGQQVVNVNPYTGSVNASIPLWQLTAGPLSYSVSLSYGGNGIRTDQYMGAAGIGWNVIAAGKVTRQMRDLPDDLLDNTSIIHKSGWLHGGATATNTFLTSFPTATCDPLVHSELTSFGGLTPTGELVDMEPDIFRISVPGHLNITFTFDESGNPVLQDTQEVTITPGFESNGPGSPGAVYDGSISSFSVTANGGIVYDFSLQTSTTIRLKGIAEETVDYEDEDVDFFRRQYFSYKESGLTYNNVWALDKITALTGEEINFSYKEVQTIIQDDGYEWETSPSQSDTVEVYLYDPATDSYLKNKQFVTNSESTHTKHLSRIRTKWETVNFVNNGVVLPKGDYDLKYPIITGLHVNDNRVWEPHTSYQFRYAPLREGKDITLYSHVILSALEVQGFEQTFSRYQFNYEGVDLENKKWGFLGLYYDEDLYGFHTNNTGDEEYRSLYIYPDQVGADRYRTTPIINHTGTSYESGGFTSDAVNTRKLSMGMLKSVVLPSGGSENITYEPNRFYDEINAGDSYGGGVRVAKLRVHDGVDYANDQQITYSYVDDLARSTGKQIYRPVYHQRLPYYRSPTSGEVVSYDDLVSLGLSDEAIWKRTLMFTNRELTESYHPGYTVGYSQVTTSRPGIGSSVAQYDIPVWLSTAESVHMPQMQTATDAIIPSCSWGLDAHDFPNYNYLLGLRFSGLPTASVQKDVNGDIVSEQNITYETIGTSDTIDGLLQMPIRAGSGVPGPGPVTGFIYHPYAMDYGTRKVRKQVESKTFDPSGSGEFVTESSNLTFDGSGKVLLSSKVDRDGQEYRTRITYADGYTITALPAQQSPEVQAINRLVELNQDVPIETLSTIMIEGVEHVTGARLTIWHLDTLNNLSYPKDSYVLRVGAPIPLTSFSQSAMVDGGTSFVYHSGYEKVSSIESRATTGQVLSQRGFGQQESGLGYAFEGRNVNLQISGATSEEVVFVDFEDFQQMLTGNPPDIAGRLASRGHQLAAGKIIRSFATTGEEYLFSCWLKADLAGQLTIKVNESDSTTIDFPTNSTEWIYYQTNLATSAEQNSTLTVSSDVAVLMDEMAFYPATASISYTHFGTNYRPVAVTDTYGNTASTTYDFAGRVETVKDKDDNIVKVYEYESHDDFPPEIQLPTYVEKDEAVTFTVQWATTCSTIRWKFETQENYSADPAAFISGLATAANSSSPDITETFATAGTWVVAVGMDCGNGWEQVGEVQTFQVHAETVGPWSFATLCIDRPLTIDWCEDGPLPYTGGCGTAEIADVVQLQVTNLQGSGPYNYVWQWTNWSVTNGWIQYHFGGNISEPGTNQTYNESYLNMGAEVYSNQAIRCSITDTATGENYQTSWFHFNGYYSDPHCPQQ